jgi:hypothetical protein
MKATLESQSEGVDPLIGVRISECERQAAKARLRQGERIADFLIAAITAMRSVMRGVARAFQALARTKPAN